MIETGYKYLPIINSYYNKDMILETQEDLHKFNKLFDAGFESTSDDDDAFIETDEKSFAKNQLTQSTHISQALLCKVPEPPCSRSHAATALHGGCQRCKGGPWRALSDSEMRNPTIRWRSEENAVFGMWEIGDRIGWKSTKIWRRLWG